MGVLSDCISTFDGFALDHVIKQGRHIHPFFFSVRFVVQDLFKFEEKMTDTPEWINELLSESQIPEVDDGQKKYGAIYALFTKTLSLRQENAVMKKALVQITADVRMLKETTLFTNLVAVRNQHLELKNLITEINDELETLKETVEEVKNSRRQRVIRRRRVRRVRRKPKSSTSSSSSTSSR